MYIVNVMKYLNYILNVHILVAFDFAPGVTQKLKIQYLELEILAVSPTDNGAE